MNLVNQLPSLLLNAMTKSLSNLLLIFRDVFARTPIRLFV
nr:MAG TPA_asm: hypothetical protein [Bacteriophage sp.]